MFFNQLLLAPRLFITLPCIVGTSRCTNYARRSICSARKLASDGSGESSESTVKRGKASLDLWLLSAIPLIGQPAVAAELSEGGFSQNSYYVTLGLFVVTLPGNLREKVVL